MRRDVQPGTGLSVGIAYLLASGTAAAGVCWNRVPRWMPELTGSIAVGWWVFGSAVMLAMGRGKWSERPGWVEFARMAWACGSLTLCVHVAAGFHVRHRWSLTSALDHTEEVSGVAEGLYVNFAVLVVWLADAVWFAVRPASYAARSRWIGYALHGFLTFIMFNAVVVYAPADVRWRGVLWFAFLIALFGTWLRK